MDPRPSDAAHDAFPPARPSPSTWRRRAARAGPWGLAAVVLALQVAGFHSLRHDDAFISYRYGQNLAQGHGLVFNPGERVMASTAPLHAMVAGLVYALVGKAALPDWMSALGCVGWLAQAAALYVLLRRALGLRGAAFVALSIAFGAAWSHRFVALETNLVTACVLWAIAAGLASRWLACATLVALGTLLRPDALLVALPLGWRCLRERGLAAWRPAALGTALLLPWALFAWLYFGSVLPTSLAAKYASVDVVGQAGRMGRYLFEHVLTPGLSIGFEGLRVSRAPPGWLGAVTALAALGGAVGLLRRDRALWPLVACPVLYAGAYLVLRAEVGFEWHLYPALVVVTALVLALIAMAADAVASRPAGRAVGGAVLAALALAVLARTAQHARIQERAFWYGARDGVYREVAGFLREHAAPDDVVAAQEVGSLAYYAERPMLDLLGLVTPDPAARARALGTRVRFAVVLLAYGGRPPPGGVVLFEAESPPILPGELALRGRDRFTAVVVGRGPLP